MSIVTPDIRSLRAQLRALRDRRVDWLADLNSRKREERDFHDRWRDRHHGHVEDEDRTRAFEHGNEKFYVTVAASREYVRRWIAVHAPGKVFLDYACGDGQNALLAARAGAALAVGIDLSATSVGNAAAAAQRDGLANADFLQADCENTGLPDNSIDVMLCSGMLHHLDLSYAFPEMRRILKPGGVCLAVEALSYNPAIQLYRRLTRKLRTEYEADHILSLKDIRFAKRFFEVRSIRYWHLLSIGTVAFRKTGLFQPALRMANSLDSFLLRIPLLSLMAWMFTFELVKRKES